VFYDLPVSDDLEIPDALAAVYRAWWTALADVTAYVATVTAQRLEMFPNPNGAWNEEAALQRRQWEPEQVAELDRLRQLRDQAIAAMNTHPLAITAREAGTWKNISTTLQQELLAQQQAEPGQP
jgi:hypothetical protein